MSILDLDMIDAIHGEPRAPVTVPMHDELDRGTVEISVDDFLKLIG